MRECFLIECTLEYQRLEIFRVLLEMKYELYKSSNGILKRFVDVFEVHKLLADDYRYLIDKYSFYLKHMKRFMKPITLKEMKNSIKKYEAKIKELEAK